MTVPNWKIERYLLEELPASEMLTLKMLESESVEFKAKLDIIRGDNKELLAKYPVKSIPEKMRCDFRKFTNIYFLPLRIAAIFLICAVALSAVFIMRENAVVINEDGTRIKGTQTDKVGMEIWRKTESSIEKLADKSVVKGGDLLQIRYIAERESYGILLSIDGGGTLTVHLRGEQDNAAKLETGEIVSLESAYELDDAPKFETFYLFTDDKEFSLAPVAETIKRGKLPKGLRVTAMTLLKKR